MRTAASASSDSARELQHDERGREWCAGRTRHWTEHLVDERQPRL